MWSPLSPLYLFPLLLGCWLLEEAANTEDILMNLNRKYFPYYFLNSFTLLFFRPLLAITLGLCLSSLILSFFIRARTDTYNHTSVKYSPLVGAFFLQLLC